jgi:hypothetical protein
VERTESHTEIRDLNEYFSQLTLEEQQQILDAMSNAVQDEVIIN